MDSDDVASAVREVVAFARPEIERQGCSVELFVADPVPPALFDEGQLRQALINLLRNAREAMPGGGPIEVRVMGEGAGVVVNIDDRGGGISDEIHSRVFDPFFSTKGEGTGLGLAITRHIVQAHGGSITLRAATVRRHALPHRAPHRACPRRAHAPRGPGPAPLRERRRARNGRPMPRIDGRSLDALRPVEMVLGFHRTAEGSVLYRAGGTVVLCTASVGDKVPPFLEGKGQGWVTARVLRSIRAPTPSARTATGAESPPAAAPKRIQRLVGRALPRGRPPRQARHPHRHDRLRRARGRRGTRTAAVTGGFVALALALGKVGARALRESVAATSVGALDGLGHALDLNYREDSRARVDLNVVATATGKIVEIQGTAEGEPVERRDIDAMVDLALSGTAKLTQLQHEALARGGVDVRALTV